MKKEINMKVTLLLFYFSFLAIITYAQTVSIDFSTSDMVKSMSGFVHAMDETDPPDSLIIPLKPAYWRGGVYLSAMGLESFYIRATGFGSKYILVLGDIWGYPPNWAMPPYNDTTAFKNFVDTICSRTSGYPMMYDIWGEPNGAGWIGTQLQFFEIFKMAHDRIRQNLGYNVEVSGPSIWWADTTYLRSFCDYCLANNVQLDVLSFHWFTNDTYTFLLKDALLWCRTNFIDNPMYASLKMKKIIVNEVVPENGQYSPGFVMAHYYYLEQGKATGACRSCWNNCWDNSLDGLLIPTTYEKLAQWWATKSYADMDSVRYRISSSNTRVYSMTGNLLTNPNTVRALIGYYHNTTPLAPINLTLTFNNLNQLPNFPSTDSIQVNVFKIPNSGLNPLTQPVNLGKFILSNNSSSITLPLLPLDTNAVIYADIISKGNISIVNNNYSESKLFVYPNPFSETTTLEITNWKNQYYELTIYDLFGRKVKKYEIKNQKTEISREDFPNGMYFFQVKDSIQNQNISSGKLIIQ